jgi:triosephosphate isomerase
MKRTPFVAGNWKMNTTRASAADLARQIAHAAPTGMDIGVAPPFVYLDIVSQTLDGSSILLGAQDVYFEKNGAFTGEISIEMLKDLGVSFVICGHSERRHVIHEPTELLRKKVLAIYDTGLILIHCVGETLEQRDGGKTLEVVGGQLEELRSSMLDPARLVVAYEPVWAIGTSRNATAQQAQEVHAFIRQELARRWNKDFADRVRIQYGGSLKPENAAQLLSQPDVDGGLIGGASLNAESFLAIVNAAKDIKSET